jgi:hypothetical protein
MINGIVGIEVEGKVVANPTLINLVNKLLPTLNPQTLGDFLNQLLIPEGVVNENLLNLLTGLVEELDSETLGAALSPMLSSPGMITLMNGLMGFWPTDATITFMNGLWPTMKEKILPYLWIKVSLIEDILILGIDLANLPILGPIIESLLDIIDIQLWGQLTDIRWGWEEG